MQEQRFYPQADRIGMVTAAVLLAYALARLIKAPGLTLTFQLPGFYFAYPFTLTTAMALMAAGIAATGMGWLLRSYAPAQERPVAEHGLLPALTTFVIGILLDILPSVPAWWVGFGFSAAILVLLFTAEYVAVDSTAPAYALASAGLTALAYALFFLFAAALRLAGARLFLMLPAMFLIAGLVVLRILRMHLTETWPLTWAGGIGLIGAQLAAGLHYWPLSSVQFGLVLLGPLYALTTLAARLYEGVPSREAMLESLIILVVCWAAVLLFRG